MQRHEYLQRLRATVARTPVIGSLARSLRSLLGRVVTPLRNSGFRSAEYWERRYAAGGTSGGGSYGVLSEFKAEFLNEFVRSREISSVVELGCGDGNQVSLARYPRYIGLDISASIIDRCRERFRHDATKSFEVYDPQNLDVTALRSDLAVSLDVIFHLVEHETFERYMSDLFSLAEEYVVIFSDDTDENPAWRRAHIRHRKFTPWIEEHQSDWRLIERVPNRLPFKGDHRTGSYCDFFVYRRESASRAAGVDRAP
jgi:SAM-dependent methyltransferase